MKEGLKILGLTVVSAIVYGVLHDMVTANVCVEYFTIFHPDLFHTTSPWLLALGWGVVATWWMGLFLGLMILAAARSGQLAKLTWLQLVKPVAILLAFSAVCSVVAGSIGYNLVVNIPEWVLKHTPELRHLSPAKQQAFTGDLFAHNASYFGSGVGALILCVWIIRTRLRSGPLTGGIRPI
jgi:hypothetical protein